MSSFVRLLTRYFAFGQTSVIGRGCQVLRLWPLDDLEQTRGHKADGNAAIIAQVRSMSPA